MNLELIAPIIEEIIKETLEEKRYPFGFARFKGVSNKRATGSLINSVQVNVVTGRGGISELQVMMNEYGEYVNSGRLAGKRGVPIQPLIEWIKARKLKPRDKKGRFIDASDKNIKGMAFGIQQNIKKYGIRPAHNIEISIKKILSDPRIEQVLLDDGYFRLDDAMNDLIDALSGI
jgi:hypothetical protein